MLSVIDKDEEEKVNPVVHVIQHIQPPHVFTDTGQRFSFGQITGEVSVGKGLDANLNVVSGAPEGCST